MCETTPELVITREDIFFEGNDMLVLEEHVRHGAICVSLPAGICRMSAQPCPEKPGYWKIIGHG